MTDPRAIFESRIQTFLQREKLLKQKSENWTLIRGAVFILAAILTYFSIKYYGNGISILTFFVGFGSFLFVVNNHLKLKIELKKSKILRQINENEINRLENKLKGFETGLAFTEQNHFYESDLDLFGEQSLYQLLNRTHTSEGKQLMANWMKSPALKSEILNRQKAAEELSKEIDFRQDLEVAALMNEKVGESTASLLLWVQSPQNQKIKKPIFKYGRYLPWLSLAVLIGAFSGLYSYYFLGLMFLIQGIILKMIDEGVTEALKQTEEISDTLKAYAELLQMIVNKEFTSEKLINLSIKLKDSAEEVSQLQKTIHFLSYRSNPVAALGGIIMMNDLRNFANLENWKEKNKNHLADWLAVVNEYEAVNSLAGFQFANPNYAIPVVAKEAMEFEVKALGHPLIAAGKRVLNDFAIDGTGKTIILTGSNMSGKSTFERTIGINIVLALMGAVVCAKKMNCAEMQLFTSMRTQDSLESETSSFYAELKRLELLIQMTNKIQIQKPIFYLLDEILKGTNSKDRHSGAKALILQLKNKQTSGIISTHDVELGDEFEGQNFIKNYSFASEMVDNDLVFDYKLKEGVCHSFNATELMRRIGIEVAP